VGIGVFGDFSFGIIFQQVSLRLVTHCAGGFGVGLEVVFAFYIAQALPHGNGVYGLNWAVSAGVWLEFAGICNLFHINYRYFNCT
jgi:hypothetical protein